jgi:hypothetical protein
VIDDLPRGEHGIVEPTGRSSGASVIDNLPIRDHGIVESTLWSCGASVIVYLIVNTELSNLQTIYLVVNTECQVYTLELWSEWLMIYLV